MDWIAPVFESRSAGRSGARRRPSSYQDAHHTQDAQIRNECEPTVQLMLTCVIQG